MPARVLNMIAFVDRDWSGEIANRLRGVGRYHASRLLVLSYEPRRERLDARVSVASEGDPAPGELALLRETVVVELGERHLDDLLTIADPLVVTRPADAAVVPPRSPRGRRRSCSPSPSRSLLDSVDEPVSSEALERACALSEQAYVVDLAWLRSTPWRERVAAAFDPPHLRRELRTITNVVAPPPSRLDRRGDAPGRLAGLAAGLADQPADRRRPRARRQGRRQPPGADGPPGGRAGAAGAGAGRT